MPGSDFPNVVAIDLGAESCRVSLLRWSGDNPHIELVHRFGNSPVSRSHIAALEPSSTSSLNWKTGCCDARSAVPIRSLPSAWTDGPWIMCGWIRQYFALGDPYCYRDARTEKTFTEMQSRCPNVELFLRSGVQPLRINTMYQLMADQKAGCLLRRSG